MREICASTSSVEREIYRDAYNGARSPRRLRHETGARGSSHGDREPVSGTGRLTLRLHDFHWVCEFLRTAARLWERDIALQPTCRGQSTCSARCKTVGTDSQHLRCFSYKLDTSMEDDTSDEVIFHTAGDLDAVESSDAWLQSGGVIDQYVAIDVGGLSFHAALKQKLRFIRAPLQQNFDGTSDHIFQFAP